MGKWIRSKDGSILYATDYVKYYEIPEKSRQKADAKGGLLNKYYKRKKSDVTVNVPEGIKEIREMANLDAYYKVFLPKTLQKVNVRGIFFIVWQPEGISGKPCAGIYRDNRY